jgi:hypothetical protein
MNKYCCEHFVKMIPAFKWYFYTDDNGNNIYTMACIEGLHLNFCPSCGKNIRGVSITEEELKNAYYEPTKE